jgi:hypothetical protein
LSDPLVLTILAYGHIPSAVGWLGASLLIGFVLGPGLERLSVPSQLEFTAKVFPRILGYITGMILGTFLFGLLLLDYIIGGDFSKLSPSTTFGAAISSGIAIAVITAIISFTVIMPSVRKAAFIAGTVLNSGGQPPPPEMRKHVERAKISSVVDAVLPLLVLVLMVTAGFY